jgi:hypothetical protein
MVGKMIMGLGLEILLKFPNVAREPGELYFFFTLFFFSSFLSSYFSFFIYIYIYMCVCVCVCVCVCDDSAKVSAEILVFS